MSDGRGEPLTFVYRPMLGSKTPEQVIRFDDVIDAYNFAMQLITVSRQRGAVELIKNMKKRH